MTISVNWSYPTNIRFGPGRIQELGEVCLALNIKNPLLVTDKGLAGLDITENDVNILKQCEPGCESFTKEDDTTFNVIANYQIGPKNANFKARSK